MALLAVALLLSCLGGAACLRVAGWVGGGLYGQRGGWIGHRSSARLAASHAEVEFSRPLHVSAVPAGRAVLCRVVAKDHERRALEVRFGIRGLEEFAANATVAWERRGLLVQGTLRAALVSNATKDDEIIEVDFQSKVLNNFGCEVALALEDHEEYDDEVGLDGHLDIGEIAAQYLAFEL